MIAAIEWIPAGRANPTPSKYEYSRTEREYLARVPAGDGDGDDDTNDQAGGGAPGPDDEDWEDADDDANDDADDDDDDDADAEDDNEDDDEEEDGGAKKMDLPEVDPASLPADLRMDEYSDEDGEEDEDIGGLLVGQDAEMVGSAPIRPRGDDGESSDSDDDDDLADIPDTREYMPLDVEGLGALGIAGGTLEDGGGYTAEDLKNMTMNNDELLDDDDDEDDEEDANDIKLHDGDAIVVVAKAEEDFASLEINVFDTVSSGLYVHHDIPLPSFPLCLALGSVVSSLGGGGEATAGNYVAVGSFEPGIEIWNLDVLNALEPTLVLGGPDTRGSEEDWMRAMPSGADGGGGGGRRKKKKGGGGAGRPSGGGLREGSHSDAVMGLSWNPVHQQVLASGSADGTVKLWDVSHPTGEGGYVRPSATLTHHTDKVQSLAWHPSEGTLLATGGYDRRVCLVDARSAAAGAGGGDAKRAKLSADCEALAWDPHGPQYLTAASEDGVVRCWDVRKFGGEPVWSMVAHEYGGVSDICYNSQVPGMLVTCSIDKTVALWDTRNESSPAPRPCGSKDMGVGKLYSVSLYPSSPWLLACGGSGKELAVWDMEGEDAVRKRFAGRAGGGDGGAAAPADGEKEEEPDFEAAMAVGDNNAATEKALEGMKKSKKKKGKKKNKAHKKR